MNPRRLLAILAAVSALPVCSSEAVVGLNRDQLIRVYGPVQEESKSVYGQQFTDLIFLAKSKDDGNNIIIAATMVNGRCGAVSYVKRDPNDKPAPLTRQEITNQMVASSKNAGGTWRQISRQEWRTDPGPEVPGGLAARWRRPELFQIFTREMLEKTGDRW
jgi:hypothetical protein